MYLNYTSNQCFTPCFLGHTPCYPVSSLLIYALETGKALASRGNHILYLYKPIHLLKLQPALCHTFRKSVLQGNPQWKTGQTSFWKSIVQLSGIRKCDGKQKEKCYALVIEFDTTCALWMAIFPPRIVSKGHVMVTRYDWMAMCGWAEVSFIAFWTAELVSDMHSNYWIWQRTSKRPRREKGNWEGWEQTGQERGWVEEYYKRRMNTSDPFWNPEGGNSAQVERGTGLRWTTTRWCLRWPW